MNNYATSGKPKSVILTCAQPTGNLTLGNYLGAVKNWSTMLDDYECFFGIVDLHAITVPPKPSDLRQNVYSCNCPIHCLRIGPQKMSSIRTIPCYWTY